MACFYDITPSGPTYRGVRYDYENYFSRGSTQKVELIANDAFHLQIQRYFQNTYDCKSVLYGLDRVIMLDLPDPIPERLCIWANQKEVNVCNMSTVSAPQEKIIRGFMGIAMEIKDVDVSDHFTVAYLKKFKVDSDVTIWDRLDFSWLPDASEPSQIKNSTKHLENLILPTELRKQYRCFSSIHMGFQAPSLSVQVNQALKVSGATDAYIELRRGEFALVAKFKKDAKDIKEPQVLAQLAAASASSKDPVMALVTDLETVYVLYWIESNSQGVREVNRMYLMSVTVSLFFCAIRAFLAGTIASFDKSGAYDLEPWMKPDSGFESNYDSEQPEGDRNARTHRCRVPSADSSKLQKNKLQKDGADRSAEGGAQRDGDVWHLPGPQDWPTAEEWEELGATYQEKATIIANVFLKYENMTPRQVHLKVVQEQEEEEIELRKRAEDHEALRSTRLALMAT